MNAIRPYDESNLATGHPTMKLGMVRLVDGVIERVIYIVVERNLSAMLGDGTLRQMLLGEE